MLKWVSLFFLSAYLLAFTPFREVLKLPVLLSHYTEHRAADPDLSFLSFFSMHYLHGSPKDADYERDMQLPFKKMTNPSVAVFVVTPVPLAIPEHGMLYSKTEKTLLSLAAVYFFNFQNSIWNPPRVC